MAISIGTLIKIANSGDTLVDNLVGGNASQTGDKLKALLRDPAAVARLHLTLCELEQSVKVLRGTKVEVGP